jgi:hypothetical protein
VPLQMANRYILLIVRRISPVLDRQFGYIASIEKRASAFA